MVGCQCWGHIQGEVVPSVTIMIVQHLSVCGHISSWKKSGERLPLSVQTNTKLMPIIIL